MFDRYSFVAITTTDLERAKRFWVDRLGFRVTAEKPGEFFMVDAGGLRLCVDRADGETHKGGGTDPVIGLKVTSVEIALRALAERGIRPTGPPVEGERGRYAVLLDPDGRRVIVTEVD